MYLKTHRYRRRKRYISVRRILFWLLVPALIFIGIGLYQNREAYIPIVSRFLNNAVAEAGGIVSTIQAPTPVPTTDPTTRIQRADAAWNQGSFQEAVNIYKEVIESVPNDYVVHYKLTLGLIMDGHDQEALAAAEKTVTANPFASDAWAIRSMALTRNGLYGEAIASALQALELNPDSARAHAFLAEAYFDMGLVAQANAQIEQAFELDADSFEAYYVRAQINAESNFDFIAAKDDYEAAYELSGGMTYIGIELAREDLIRPGGDPEEGLAKLKEMDERNPNNPLILAELGAYYFRNGDMEQASTYLTRCVTSSTDAIYCHFWQGRVLDATEQPEAAAESFKTAIDLGSQEPQHFWWAADSQLSIGNCPASAEYLEAGHAIAVQINSQYTDDLEDSMRKSPCGAFNDIPTLEPTETPESLE